MARMLKRLLRPLWRLTLPVRRPLVGRLHAHAGHVVTAAIGASAAPLAEAFAARVDADGLHLALDSVVRELVRLQMQVDVLRQALEQGPRPWAGPALARARNGAGLAGEGPDLARAG
jgi:hypothetical protein